MAVGNSLSLQLATSGTLELVVLVVELLPALLVGRLVVAVFPHLGNGESWKGNHEGTPKAGGGWCRARTTQICYLCELVMRELERHGCTDPGLDVLCPLSSFVPPIADGSSRSIAFVFSDNSSREFSLHCLDF